VDVRIMSPTRVPNLDGGYSDVVRPTVILLLRCRDEA
jgi:hypothetical protein